jgi:6-phosphofructokinase 1
LASQTDLEQSYALGSAAVDLALAGNTSVMLTIERKKSSPYVWDIGTVPLSDVANIEKSLPRNYIDNEGFGITQACRNYLLPLIQGEAHPPYKEGLPYYSKPKFKSVRKKLSAYSHQ